MYGDDANDMLCSRSIPPDIDKTPPINKKRGRDNMDTSTPVNVRRETKLLDLEDSPIDIDPQNSSQGCSGANDYSDETIPTSKTKAGLSNEVDTMAVTPPPVISPDTMDRRLMLHSIDIIKASENNARVTELHEGVDHTLSIGLNAFARRSDGTIGAGAVLIDVDSNEGKMDEQSVAMDGMNKDPLGGDKGVRSVVMDEMNKDPVGGGIDARSAVMDEMNRTPLGGGRVNNDEEKRKEKVTRVFAKASRKVKLEAGQKLKLSSTSLGVNAPKNILTARACPSMDSPKRPIPMEVDTPASTSIKKRKMERSKKHKLTVMPPNQQLLSDMWKKNFPSTSKESNDD